jgi:hypothetical protein
MVTVTRRFEPSSQLDVKSEMMEEISFSQITKLKIERQKKQLW